MKYTIPALLGVDTATWEEFASYTSAYFNERGDHFSVRYIEEYRKRGRVQIILDAQDLEFLMDAAKAYFPEKYLLAYGYISAIWNQYVFQLVVSRAESLRVLCPHTSEIFKN